MFNHTWTTEHLNLVLPNVKHLRGEQHGLGAGVSREKTYDVESVTLQRVLTGGRWPSALGGRGYPSQRREYSQVEHGLTGQCWLYSMCGRGILSSFPHKLLKQ